MSYWLAPMKLVIDGREATHRTGRLRRRRKTWMSLSDQMMLLDTLTYLPDDILVKVDRASMAVALEVRAPLLDHRVMEFAWRLPLTLKLHKDRGKLVLRKVLSRYVPEKHYSSAQRRDSLFLSIAGFAVLCAIGQRACSLNRGSSARAT